VLRRNMILAQLPARIKAACEAMPEAYRVVQRVRSMPCFGNVDVEVDRILRHLCQFQRALRGVFLRYSILAVSNLSRPMRMSFFQWEEMANNLMLLEPIKQHSTIHKKWDVYVEELFLRQFTIPVDAEAPIIAGCPVERYMARVLPPDLPDVSGRDEKRLVHLAEFIDTLVLVSRDRRMYADLAESVAPTEGGAPSPPARKLCQNPSLSQSTRLMLEACFGTWNEVAAKDLFGDSTFVDNLMLEKSFIRELENWQAKLRKVHRLRSIKGQPGNMDPDGFLRTINDARLIGSGLSFAKCLESFVGANQKEIAQYLDADPELKVGDFMDELLLEYPEFEEACVRCMAHIFPKKGKVAMASSVLSTKLSEMLFMITANAKK